MDGTAGTIDPLLDHLNVGFDAIFGDRRRPVELAESESMRRQRENLDDEYEAAHAKLQETRRAMAESLPGNISQQALLAIEDYVDAKAKLKNARDRRESMGLPT